MKILISIITLLALTSCEIPSARAQGMPNAVGSGVTISPTKVSITDTNGTCSLNNSSGPNLNTSCTVIPSTSSLFIGTTANPFGSVTAVIVDAGTLNVAGNINGGIFSSTTTVAGSSGANYGNSGILQTGATDYQITVNSGALNLSPSGSVKINGVVINQGVGDGFITINDPVTVVGTTGDIWISGPTKTSMTLQDCDYVVPIAGGGTGTLTTKLSSAASGGGTVFTTFSIACNATAGTSGTCTINTAAVPASTTFHYAITAACTTADVLNQVSVHYSQP